MKLHFYRMESKELGIKYNDFNIMAIAEKLHNRLSLVGITDSLDILNNWVAKIFHGHTDIAEQSDNKQFAINANELEITIYVKATYIITIYKEFINSPITEGKDFHKITNQYTSTYIKNDMDGIFSIVGDLHPTTSFGKQHILFESPNQNIALWLNLTVLKRVIPRLKN